MLAAERNALQSITELTEWHYSDDDRSIHSQTLSLTEKILFIYAETAEKLMKKTLTASFV